MTNQNKTENKEETKQEEQKNVVETKGNPMRKIKIRKLILSVSGIDEELNKGFKIIQRISNKKPIKIKSRKRIPSLGVRPGLEVGAMVTIRNQKEIYELLKRILEAVDNKLKRKQIHENGFSFGIQEYIEIPGIDYQRDIGIVGFDVTVVFSRYGRRVIYKKIKSGKLPKKQIVNVKEIIKFMENNFQTEFIGKQRKEDD